MRRSLSRMKDGSSSMMTIRYVALVALLGAVGCGSGSAPPSDDTGEIRPASCAAGLPISGESPIRRRTHFEYDNTIRDLLGQDDPPSAAFPPDERAAVFDNDAEAQTV